MSSKSKTPYVNPVVEKQPDPTMNLAPVSDAREEQKKRSASGLLSTFMGNQDSAPVSNVAKMAVQKSRNPKERLSEVLSKRSQKNA